MLVYNVYVQKYTDLQLVALKQDRLNGYTVPKLMAKYSIPKTSIWHHIKDLRLSQQAKQVINSSRGGSAARAQVRWTSAQERAEELLRDFDEKNIWAVLLTALYWAEGTKSSFVFTNTDDSMIKIFLKLVRNYLKILDKDMDVLIRICRPMKPEQCRRHWSEITGISLSDIRINYHDKHNKSTTTYGMCRITFRVGGNHLKLMHCLIRELTAKMLPPILGSRSSMDRTSHS